MMTQQLEVSILAAPLAAIDPRALSQAWYAALRLGRRMPSVAATLTRATDRTLPRTPLHRVPTRLNAVPVRLARVPRSHAPQERRICEEGECVPARAGRAPLPQLAGAIEKAFVDGTLRRATFSVGRGSARIHVVLQTRGNRTTLIALCRPHLREAVARALAQARVALAARGIGVELRTQGNATCS